MDNKSTVAAFADTKKETAAQRRLRLDRASADAVVSALQELRRAVNVAVARDLYVRLHIPGYGWNGRASVAVSRSFLTGRMDTILSYEETDNG